ncbi:MAG TPA: hypothetical protein PKC51_13285 [Ferruginibacter sp.]|jgi:hypothetical protein|nr:hypothetical protein [Ferruginibacter sp.]HNJ96055.1 hypothetical protein [Ferruginibacter sp.]
MQKAVAFLLLLCHMNTSMFLPQVAETDFVDTGGQYKDDINSIAEYFSVVLGYDHTADDEDDDSGQNFHLTNAYTFFYTPNVLTLEENLSGLIPHNYTGYTSPFPSNPFYDVTAPPPKI